MSDPDDHSKKRKEKKRKEKKRKDKKRKEKTRKDCAFWCQSNEKPSVIPGCPGDDHSTSADSVKQVPLVPAMLAVVAGQIDCPSVGCKAGYWVTCVVSTGKQRKL